MFLKLILKLILNLLLDIVLTLFYIIKNLSLCLIPMKFFFKSVDKKIILITGGGSGIGRGLAIRFAKRGAIIVIWDINNSGLKQTANEIKSIGGTVFSFVCDITDRHMVYETANKVRELVGNVDILFNNAGIVNGKKILDISDEKVIQIFNVNAISHFWLYKAFLPHMMATNSGHLVTIASVAGVVGVPGITGYCATKFSLIGLEESLRLELLRDGFDGIKTSIIFPYFVDTGMSDGVNTSLIPMLTTDYVCDQIMDAVLSEQTFIFIPQMFKGLLLLKSILPNEALNIIYKYFGVNKMFTNVFVGRNELTNGERNDVM